MKSADLPKENAFEPDEGAHQPLLQNNMNCEQNIPKKISFASNIIDTENQSSQTSSSYRDVLSQPANSLSHSQKMLWLQKRRTAGLWAQCDICDRWRYLPNIIDRYELPSKWYCSMNPDSAFANCSVPEAPLRLHDEEDLIHSEYSAGSLVWARLTGWPWWPAMVDDCPDAEQFYWLDGFSDIPTHYNVVFFDDAEATRAWIDPENLKPYASNKKTFKSVKNKTLNRRLTAAVAQANEAENMSLVERLEKFSFISRHKGKINSPKKVNINDLKKYQKRFKNKFNIEFPIENSDTSMNENDSDIELTPRNRNVIMLGTPKRARKEKDTVSLMGSVPSDKNEDYSKMNNKENNDTVTTTKNLSEESSAVNTDKPPNSMVVQIGSTEATYDNDTSTTYLPDKESGQHDLSIRMDTPNSDDFEF